MPSVEGDRARGCVTRCWQLLFWCPIFGIGRPSGGGASFDRPPGAGSPPAEFAAGRRLAGPHGAERGDAAQRVFLFTVRYHERARLYWGSCCWRPRLLRRSPICFTGLIGATANTARIRRPPLTASMQLSASLLMMPYTALGLPGCGIC